MWPHKTQAAFQSCFSNPMLAFVLSAILLLLPYGYGSASCGISSTLLCHLHAASHSGCAKKQPRRSKKAVKLKVGEIEGL